MHSDETSRAHSILRHLTPLVTSVDTKISTDTIVQSIHLRASGVIASVFCLPIQQVPMDSVTAFNVFVRVAETRSFVAAGQLLGVSASAVGKSVSRLESRLAVRLFHRSTRSISLTEEGSKFLERSRHILAEILAAEAELSQASATPRGRLRIRGRSYLYSPSSN
jgi:hypothetical protein